MSGMTDNNEFDSIADGMRNDVSEIREMLIHNHDLTAEIRRLREENERLQELRLHRMEIESGKVNFGISGEAGRAFAAILLKFFEDNGGKNFFSFDVEKDEMNLNVTIQNLNGELSVTDKLNQLQAENTKLKKELKGIGAEQYYTMRQKYWDEQKENVALHKKVMRLERDHHVNMNNCRSDIQIWQEDYERRYVDLAKQTAELAEVLREISSYPQFEETNNGDRFYKQMRDSAREVLSKYGLEEEK